MSVAMEAEPIHETKTARKKREKAARLAVLADRQSAQRAAEKDILNLMARLCSRWWAEEVARYGEKAYLPNAVCLCPDCDGRRRWPSPVVEGRRGRGLSFECHVIALAPTDSHDRWTSDFGELSRAASSVESRRVSKGDAAAAGLHVVRRRAGEYRATPRGITLLLSGCEICEGLKPVGDRYCMGCRAMVKKAMREDGYFQ